MWGRKPRKQQTDYNATISREKSLLFAHGLSSDVKNDGETPAVSLAWRMP